MTENASIEPFIKCSNIRQSLQFYTEVLDFDVTVFPDPNPEQFMSKYALLERNAQFVHLSAHQGDGAYGNLIYIHTSDIDELYMRYKQNGLGRADKTHKNGITIELVEQSWGMKEFSVSDPDGNKIRFGQFMRKR